MLGALVATAIWAAASVVSSDAPSSNGGEVAAIPTESSTAPPGQSSSEPSPSTDNRETYPCDDSGNDRRCDALEWSIRVAEKAGFDLDPYDGGGAPEIQKSSSYFYISANTPQGPADRTAILVSEGYERIREVGGIDIYSDGIRVTWDVQGLFVWVSSADLKDIDVFDKNLDDLVHASKQVAWR